jgi:hypothetical protein
MLPNMNKKRKGDLNDPYDLHIICGAGKMVAGWSIE